MNAHRLLPMDEVLSHIEHFLLPTADDRYLPINRRKRRDYSSSPHARLDHILYQVALADHIRMMQIMYRDSEDEQCLAPELREGDTSVKLPTKHLMEKLSEGRSRIMALCRTCHGEDSLESLRASVDLASSYALQGMWSQVRSHVAIASQQLISKENPSDIEEQHVRQSRGKQAARRVSCCYRVLRSHSLKNRGQIKASFLNELHTELSTIKFDDVVDGKEDSDKEDSALYYATKLTAELHEFFEFFILNKKDGGSPSFEEKENGNLIKTVPSWGDVINYLRDESAVMYVWMRELEVAILPQNKAALHLPFRLCDDQKKGVAHPTQLTTTYMKFSNSLKVISNTNLLKKIKDLKIETPIMINLRNGEMTDPVGEGRSNSDEQENIIRVVYELPVAWEEVLSMYVVDAEGDHLGLLKALVLILMGVSQVFSYKLTAAEENLTHALKQFEKHGLEMEVNACELYNSIAQLMITRHRQAEGVRKIQLKKDAVDWLLGSEEGRAGVREKIIVLKQHYSSRSMSYSTAGIEMEAKNMAIRERIKHLLASDRNPTKITVEAAYRYLVRSHEILETAHGSFHPAVATGCLAVASVQNILEGYEESREWLVRALRCMEKLDPLPVRAIAFVQLQLSQVLNRQGYEEESTTVLSRAADFHRSAAYQGLLKIHEDSLLGKVAINRPKKGQILFDDVMLTADLTARIIRAHGRKGLLDTAAELAEGAANLMEMAFQWDNMLTAESWREAGERFAAVGDWQKACLCLRRSLEGLDAVCGRKDKRALEVARLLAAALENKVRTQHLVEVTDLGKNVPEPAIKQNNFMK